MIKYYFVRASYIVNRMCLQDTKVVKVDFQQAFGTDTPEAKELQDWILSFFFLEGRKNIQLEQVTLM